jgi:hypothetical protein
VEVRNPTSPTLVGSYPLPGCFRVEQVVGNFIYIRGHRSGVHILRVSGKEHNLYLPMVVR